MKLKIAFIIPISFVSVIAFAAPIKFLHKILKTPHLLEKQNNYQGECTDLKSGKKEMNGTYLNFNSYPMFIVWENTEFEVLKPLTLDPLTWGVYSYEVDSTNPFPPKINYKFQIHLGFSYPNYDENQKTFSPGMTQMTLKYEIKDENFEEVKMVQEDFNLKNNKVTTKNTWSCLYKKIH